MHASRGLAVVALAALAVLVSATDVSAQGMMNVAGVAVDAEGVLVKRVFNDPGNRLMRQRIAVARADLPQDLARRSPLRKISLNRLQAAIDALIADGKDHTAAMACMAGLTRVTHVFFFPDSGDIVIAGPAEGWCEDLAGRIRGIETGLPTCKLDHFLVAMRAYPPGKKGPPLVGCSIDPTQEGLKRMQQYLSRVRPRSPREAPRIVKGLRESLGLQNISVLGIDPKTEFAHIMVEADYRMKLIGIGLERPPVKFKNYVDRASATQVSRNAMQRWFFVPDYKCVRMSDDRLAMELVGDGVKLIGEDEFVNPDGQRVQNAQANRASKLYVEAFTKNYPELAAKSPVYAQLRVLIDMLVVSAHIQQEDYYGKANWHATTLLDEEKVAVRVKHAPKQVATAVNAVMKGSRLLTPVGGGVQIQARKAFESANLLKDEDGKVKAQHEKLSLDGLAPGQWWWD